MLRFVVMLTLAVSRPAGAAPPSGTGGQQHVDTSDTEDFTLVSTQEPGSTPVEPTGDAPDIERPDTGAPGTTPPQDEPAAAPSPEDDELTEDAGDDGTLEPDETPTEDESGESAPGSGANGQGLPGDPQTSPIGLSVGDRCSKTDPTVDPFGPVDTVLDGLATAGFTVGKRVRTDLSFRGVTCRAEIRGEAHGLLQYQLERLASEGFVLELAPLDSYRVILDARRPRGNEPQSVRYRQVDKVSIDGRFLSGDSAASLAQIIGLDRERIDPRVLNFQLEQLGYRAEFFPVAEGELIIQVKPARSIRRVRIHGHLPLSKREVQRKLSIRARPGALAYGQCVEPKRLRKKGPKPLLCEVNDEACLQWERDEVQNLNRFLFDRGYLKGKATLALVCGRSRDEADVHVYLDKGKAYRVRRKDITINGNAPDRNKGWIRRTYFPRIKATPFAGPVTREHIEEATERTEQKFAEPRDSVIRSSASIDLRYLYPDIQVETNYEDLTRSEIPDNRYLDLDIKVDVGRGVSTSFTPLPAARHPDLSLEEAQKNCQIRKEKGERRVLSFTDKRLRGQLQLFKRRESPSPEKADQEATHLRVFYQSKGYLLARVTGCYSEFGARSVLGQLTFLIDEGPRVSVRKIDIERPVGVPSGVAQSIRREYAKVAELKRGSLMTEQAFDADLTALLTAYHNEGYLCAQASAKVAFWPEGLEKDGEHALVDLATIHSQTGAPMWIEQSFNPKGLTAIRERRRARLYIKISVNPGPRVYTSDDPVNLRYLETPIPASRDVSDLPLRESGDWGAMRMLRDSPLKPEEPDEPDSLWVSPSFERNLEDFLTERYRNEGYPLADTKIRWVYKHPTTNEVVRVPQAKFLADPSVGMCVAHRSGTGVKVVPEINVYEGKSGKFGEHLIRGNFKTRDWVLRREIEWKRGYTYSKSKVDQTREHIDGTGVAESVVITPHPVNCEVDAPGTCEVHEVIEIREAKDVAMNISGGLGLATLDPLYVFLTPSFPNVFGTAWDFDVHGHFGFDVSDLPSAGLLQADCSNQRCFERSVRGNLQRPRFLASPLTLKITGQVQQRATPARGEVVSILGTLGFQWPISKRWQLYFGYLIQAANISKDVYKSTTTPGSLVINRRDAIVTDRTGALQVGATYTNIEDNPFNPDEGFIATADLMFASPAFGGLDWWVRGELSWQQFIMIPRTQNRLNFRYSLRYGHAVPLSGLPLAETTSIPEVWRYFGGGTVDRGIRGITPETMLVDVEEINETNGLTRLRYTPVGGHIRALGTVALQVVSVRDFVGGNLAHSLFYDFGILTQKWQHVQLPRDLRHSVGVNFIKWNIRLVTIAVGYAVLVPNAIAPGNVRPTDDANGRFVFDVGVTF